MKIKWYGHAAFRLTTADGVNVVIDPYQPGAFGLSYNSITDAADLVLISHDHADHNFLEGIKGEYMDLRREGSYEIKGIRVTAIPTFHDPSKGTERGQNLIFVLEADDLRIAHLGDLGHMLGPDVVARIGKADVLMIPVGSVYTIDAMQATEVVNTLKPSMVLPMHYRTAKSFPLDDVDQFTKGKERVRKVKSSEIEVAKASLPKETEIVVLDYAS